METKSIKTLILLPLLLLSLSTVSSPILECSVCIGFLMVLIFNILDV